MYRERLVRLRDLYVGQFDHLRHSLQEKRRQFLLRWQQQNKKRKHGEFFFLLMHNIIVKPFYLGAL